MSAGAHKPSSGGKVVLDLERVGAAEVVYTAELHTPDAEWRGRVVVTLAAGEVGWTWPASDDAPPPAWLIELAQRFLRGVWRARNGADPDPWPQRINRWRDARDR